MLEVHAYELACLRELFVRFSDESNPAVGRKDHIGYLGGYLDHFGCRSVVVETDYIDRDYLEDFAAYHVRSFREYRRHCARLHFFTVPLTLEELQAAIVGDDVNLTEWRRAYLGFLVLKPLPTTVIGRTCLRPYEQQDEQAERHYPPVCGQHVDLCGLGFEVTTLPFQEQDRDVAACASSALWSVFQATGRRFQHAIPSPVAITAAATRSGHEERVLPNAKGLSPRQMGDAIRAVGLEPHVIDLSATQPPGERLKKDAKEKEEALKRLSLRIAVAAYLRAGIPCLLLVRLYRRSADATEWKGGHAVAVSGYHITDDPPLPYGETGTLFAGTRIDRIYVHDDQVGPFARMRFDAKGQLSTSWLGAPSAREEMVAEPTSLIVPLYHKIRIPLEKVWGIALQLDALLELLGRTFDAPPEVGARVVWDIELSDIAGLRSQIRAADLDIQLKLKLLTRPLPRFIWRLKALGSDSRALFELLLDPTDLLQGHLYLDIVPYVPSVVQFLGMAAQLLDRSGDQDLSSRVIREAFAEHAPTVPIASEEEEELAE